jgi:hypothetical protein
MSLYHGKYRDPIYERDPCNTLFTDWDAHNDWVITWMIASFPELTASDSANDIILTFPIISVPHMRGSDVFA